MKAEEQYRRDWLDPGRAENVKDISLRDVDRVLEIKDIERRIGGREISSYEDEMEIFKEMIGQLNDSLNVQF